MKDKVAKAYEAEFGEAKLAVQQQLAKAYYPCCAEPKGGLHNPACRKYVEPVMPELIDGQESLL